MDEHSSLLINKPQPVRLILTNYRHGESILFSLPWILTIVLPDAAQGGGAAGRAGAKASAGDALTRQTGMTIDEACQILNVNREAELAEVAKVRIERER